VRTQKTPLPFHPYSIRFALLPPEKEKERLRVKPLQDAFAFTKEIIYLPIPFVNENLQDKEELNAKIDRSKREMLTSCKLYSMIYASEQWRS
jgi:hypothetical protein